jgi:hypothetical protein
VPVAAAKWSIQIFRSGYGAPSMQVHDLAGPLFRLTYMTYWTVLRGMSSNIVDFVKAWWSSGSVTTRSVMGMGCTC